MVNGDARIAKDMTLEFYRSILFSSVSEEGSAIVEADWRAYAEWDWGRSAYHETNETKKYPFILCDNKEQNEPDATMLARERIVTDALGLTDTENVDLADYLYTVINSDTEICVVGSFLSSLAANLNYVVQPISFLMKTNSGTTKFSPNEYTTSSVAQIEYFVVACPGLDEEFDKEWWQKTMRDFVPWLEYLVKEGALPGQDELLELKGPLEDNPAYCDSTLQNETDIDRNSTGYARVSLTTNTFKSRSCFQIFAYAMAAAPEICYIERIAPVTTDNEDAQWTSQSNTVCDFPFFDSGLSGKNQIVSMSDSGIDLGSCYFKDSKDIEYSEGGNVDESRRKIIDYIDFADSSDDPKGHGTHVAGTIAGHKSLDGTTSLNGYGNGVAPDAKLAFVDLGKTGMGGLSVPNPVSLLLKYGRNAGAKIHSASWGSNEKKYSVQENIIDYDLKNDDSFLMIVAAGNSGPNAGTIGSPAKAKNVITVGATRLNNRAVHELATFSSRGPTMDNRIKPDIVAYGSNVLSAGAEDDFSCESDTKPDKGKSTFGLAFKSGTSMATPVVSGSAALVRQYFEEGWHGDGSKSSTSPMDISGVLLKAVIINGARPLSGYAINEVDSKQGFGLISLIDSIPLSGKNDMTSKFFDRQMITEGAVDVYKDELPSGCESGSYEFSVTLVWADTPGTLGCKQCLLNDLDLKATQVTPTGTNVHFPNGLVSGKDQKNNVERIRFDANPRDSITVTVTAAKLDMDSQSYALAAIASCKGFISTHASSSKCDSLYSGGYSGAYHFQSWWKTSLVFVWFPLLVIMH